MSSGLQLLSGYDSGSDECDTDGHVDHKAKRRKLPLPDVLKVSADEEMFDEPSLHDGRQRSFPHKRGNWASHIYIPFTKTESFDFLYEQIFEFCSPEVDLVKVKDPHISLTKTFVLFYHWIKEFHASVKEKLKIIPRFEIGFDGIKVYCNEQLSRTFIAITVGMGKKELSASVNMIDKCLQEYRLQPFYEDGSFHMSVGWCLGNKKDVIEQKMVDMEKLLDIFVSNPDFTISVNDYVFKAGFKEFTLNLGHSC